MLCFVLVLLPLPFEDRNADPDNLDRYGRKQRQEADLKREGLISIQQRWIMRLHIGCDNAEPDRGINHEGGGQKPVADLPPVEMQALPNAKQGPNQAEAVDVDDPKQHVVAKELETVKSEPPQSSGNWKKKVRHLLALQQRDGIRPQAESNGQQGIGQNDA